MADAVQLFFADAAEAAVRGLWQRLDDHDVPSMTTRTHRQHRPHVTLAAAGSIPERTRRDLRAELTALSIPDLWLHTLGTFPGEEPALLLSAVVDTEVLAVHNAVHDLLAGRVKNPSAYHFPGTWIPHCPLAQGVTVEQVTAGFTALCPAEPIRAAISGVGITDTRTGEVTTLLG